MAPLITLTTDFGTRDPYVAELKGVLLSQGPEALRVVDLSHELDPFDVHAAALFVRAAVPRFPAHTVHVVVVDPGVGSRRRALIVERGDSLLVGPDNCVFSYLYDGSEVVYEIDPARLGARPISATFHGRDVFAPVAAQLATGAPPSALGSRIDVYERMVFPMVDMQGDVLHGRVIHVDRYGNLITNIAEGTLRSFLGLDERAFTLVLGDHTIRSLSTHYAEARPGELLALVGSSGLIEVAAREASASRLLAAEVGRAIRVQRPS
jgi:S-adenosyl-L-methionine hydrolase (adenosine-forming)